MTITCAIIDDEPGSRTIKKLCGRPPSSNSSDPTVVPLRL